MELFWPIRGLLELANLLQSQVYVAFITVNAESVVNNDLFDFTQLGLIVQYDVAEFFCRFLDVLGSEGLQVV